MYQLMVVLNMDKLNIKLLKKYIKYVFNGERKYKGYLLLGRNRL